MGSFLTDPFGGSFAGRVYTKVAKNAAGKNDYSITRRNETQQKSRTENQTLDTLRQRGFTDDDFVDKYGNKTKQPQQQQQQSWWQKTKTAVKEFFNPPSDAELKQRAMDDIRRSANKTFTDTSEKDFTIE